MTLLERTQSLETRAKRQREQDAREEVAKKFRARTSNLEKNLKQLKTARARATALEEAGHERSAWPAPPADAFAAYDLKEPAPLSIELTRQAEWEKFVLTLGKFVEKAERAVGQDIKQAKKSTLEGVSSEDLRGYLDDPSTEAQARELLGTLESLSQRSWEALAEPDLVEVLRLGGAFREGVVRLRETGASEELRRFLALARKDGAPLGALSDTLHAELETRKLLDRLRLVLK